MDTNNHIPNGFSKWKRDEDGWSLAIGDYIAVVEYDDAINMYHTKVNSAACSSQSCSETLEEALQWGENAIMDDCAETIRRCGEARLARFVQRADIYPEFNLVSTEKEMKQDG